MIMKSVVFSCIAILFCGLAVQAQTDWQLYDNFNSDQIDPTKWEIDNSSADITIENGKAKFEHKSGFANDSSYLYLIKNPKTIVGLKATITVSSCSGDVRARLASFIGKIGDDYVFTSHEVRADRDYISVSLPVVGPEPDYEYKYDYFWGHFERPLDYIGFPFTLSMILSKDHADYAVEGQGEIEFYFPSTLSSTDNPFKGIGTQSTSGDGTCTVYVDDVYVLRQPLSPAGNLLLLDE
jgi:hypothetical protein